MVASANGRVVVITGANEGIGHHLLRALVEDGYRVAGLDVEGDQLVPLQDAHPDRIRYVECDVTNDEDVPAAIDAVIDRWGHIDVLVNNAAIFSFGGFEEQSIEDLRGEFEVNYFGYVRTIRAVLPHMKSRNAGIVHNVSSGVGLVGSPGLTGYASTKGAIEALVRSLGLELRYENVSCTIVHPPLTATRSAKTLGYPSSLLNDPADVGRKLASKIESTDPVIAADWTTKIGLTVSRLFPSLVKRGTARFVREDGTITAARDD